MAEVYHAKYIDYHVNLLCYVNVHQFSAPPTADSTPLISLWTPVSYLT